MPKYKNNEYDLSVAFKVIEDELIASMIRNLRNHRAEETLEGMEWSQWQVEQLRALEKYKRLNSKKFGTQFKNMNTQIDELIRMQRAAGNSAQEVAILNAIKKGFPAKKVSVGAAAEFFRLNDRKLEALIKATVSDMQKAETAILRMANDQYRKAIFNAQVYANTGAGTYETAVDMATKDMLAAGLNCVQYANGARHTLSDYAYMAIQTASKRAYLQGEGEKRQEWGISTVVMNKRGNPCPKCLPFVGKILIDDVWSGGKVSDGPYQLMSAAIAAGLYHPRCQDSHTTYFDKISTPPDDVFTRRELLKIEKENQQEAKGQYAKRQEDKFNRLARYSLCPDKQREYALRAEEWERKAHDYRYHEFDERYLAKNDSELLPSHNLAKIDDNKLIGYALNKMHPKGKDKAVAFEKYLGYTIDNKDELSKQIHKNLGRYRCSKRDATQYGQPFEVAMVIKGANGRFARVKTGWIIDTGSDTPRLTSLYVDE